MPIEITPGITVTAGVTFEANPVPAAEPAEPEPADDE
jgi:hypothetical protein